MKVLRTFLFSGAVILPVLMSGCYFTTRKLPIPKAPLLMQTVAADELVNRLNQRWAALETLNATVDIKAKKSKVKEGLETSYTSFRGLILMRKPGLLRVYGRVPVIGTCLFDMASDGKDFTLYIPSKSKVIKGSNSLHKKSANQVENLRPGFFFDAMMVRGLEPEDLYQVTAETITPEDAERKHILLVPEYILSISRRKPGSQELEPVRVVRFHRDDLLPYEQDIYDADGNLETQVTYENYQDFGGSKYPSTVTIERPLEEYQIVLTVEKVVENMTLTDDQFTAKVPEGTPVQQLE